MPDKFEDPADRLTLKSRRFGLALHGATLMTFLAASAAPTPLYRVYQEAFGFSPLLLTIIFSVYAFSLLLALLVAGSLSDHIGRRPVVFLCILLQALAMLLFIAASSPGWLIAARVVQGLATGAASGAIGAAMLDVNRLQGPVVNSIAPLVGMAVGALGSGMLIEMAPAPTQLVYIVLIAMLLAQSVLVWFTRETVLTKPGAWASLRPNVEIPPQARRPLMLITPLSISLWALGGFYLSLMPSLVAAATGSRSPLTGGFVVAALTLSGAIAVFLLRRKPPLFNLTIGVVATVLGLLTVLGGLHAGQVQLLFSGTFIAGIGFGAGFIGALSTIVPLAGPDERAGLLSAYYVQSYLAFSLPAIAAGFLSRSLGLAMTADIYIAAIILLTASGYIAMRKGRLHAAQRASM